MKNEILIIPKEDFITILNCLICNSTGNPHREIAEIFLEKYQDLEENLIKFEDVIKILDESEKQFSTPKISKEYLSKKSLDIV